MNAFAAVPICAAALFAQSPAVVQGPLLGHVDTESARFWVRVDAPGTYRVAVRAAGGKEVSATATAVDERDRCMVFTVAGLGAGQEYEYCLFDAKDRSLAGPHPFVTAPDHDADCGVRVMFGSCAREDEGTAGTWRRVARERPSVVVLLGDTPYIDNTRLEFQRKRYAAFAGFEPMAELLRTTPWYGTWDDHDFGTNDTDGRQRGQQNSRRAFVEYHANPSYGDGQRGIYTSFRRGPVEVFLLDTRTFAATEPSPFMRHRASLLGAAQWRWLLQALKESSAPVKVLACGMIWNDATRPGKLDHWGSYPHEREALFRAIGKQKIAGVVLVGGDIHRSRVVRHASKQLAGYDIVELISSPMHDSIIASANAPHPGLLKDMGTPHTFVLLEAIQEQRSLKSVRARFVDAEGREHFAIDL